MSAVGAMVADVAADMPPTAAPAARRPRSRRPAAAASSRPPSAASAEPEVMPCTLCDFPLSAKKSFRRVDFCPSCYDKVVNHFCDLRQVSLAEAIKDERLLENDTEAWRAKHEELWVSPVGSPAKSQSSGHGSRVAKQVKFRTLFMLSSKQTGSTLAATFRRTQGSRDDGVTPGSWKQCDAK